MAIRQTNSEISPKDRFDHFLVRWGYRRGEHRVEPGLYAIGRPDRNAPVFVTANYTLSFDALRSALKSVHGPGIDGYILVLDTFGINVWCAAGKGTFGTDELVRRIEATGLKDVVAHRRLVLPQLGAPGVRAHEVAKRTGFRVEYGPVRARDLGEYLKTGKATPEMRRVRFPLADRIVLVPVELVATFLPALVLAVAAFLAMGWVGALAVVAAALAGLVLFPVLLPYLPTKDYSTKGLLLGLVAALPFAAYEATRVPAPALEHYGSALSFLLLMPAAVAYLTLNFTGSTPYPSRTGVRKEIFTYIPIMAGMAIIGVVLLIAMIALSYSGVI